MVRVSGNRFVRGLIERTMGIKASRRGNHRTFQFSLKTPRASHVEAACICVTIEGGMSDAHESSREADINETNERTLLGEQSWDNHGFWGVTPQKSERPCHAGI